MHADLPTTSAPRFLDFFAAATSHAVVAVRPAGAAQRPDPDVHQRRHGAVQERLHRRRDARPTSARRPRRNACAPAASTTTSTTSATPPATTPSSRCSATSRSATTSRTGDRARLGAADQGVRPADGQAAGHRLSRPTTRRSTSGRRSRACRRARIIRIATDDNFWAMGDTGPCGPCSEIFFDHGAAHPGRPARQPRRGRRPLRRDLEPRLHAVRAGRRRTSASPLPKPSIDTGMGLERIAAVLQGVHDNYDIDLFAHADRGLRRR